MSVQTTTLDNGLRVVTDGMPHLETASVGVWVDVGARHESASLNGVSHMLEHMAFKGTKRRSALAIAEEIEAVGGYLNAYTSREQTAYFARVMKDDVPLAVDLLADILQHSTFDADELERERDVIIQEIGQTNDTPDDLVFDLLQEAAYPNQPMGRSILGTMELVRGFNRDHLSAYMAAHYRAPEMVVAAAGRVDHDRIVALAAEAFLDLPGETENGCQPARYTGGALLDERTLDQVHFTLGFDSVSFTDDDYYAAQVYATVLGGGMSSRLFQEVREKRGLAYSIHAFTSSYNDGGTLAVYAGTGDEEVRELVPVVCDELNKMTQGVSEEEVARARAQLKAGMLMSLESSSSRCEQMGRQILVYGRVLDTSEVIREIDKVDAAAVMAVAKRHLDSGPPAVSAVGPLARLETYDTIAARFG
jgi:predicted Zn-dependent peptidase